MRPPVLNPLFVDVGELKGVGPKLSRALGEFVGGHLVDLLWHFPRGLTNRSWRPTVVELERDRVATLRLTIGKHKPSIRRGMPYRIDARDDTGQMTLVFFNARAAYLKQALPEGEERVVSGKVELYGKTYQMVHPDYIFKPEEEGHLPSTEPLYGLTTGVTQRVILKVFKSALERVPDLSEWLEQPLMTRHRWQSWKKSIIAVHSPRTIQDLDAASSPRQRLAYDELLANELMLHLVRIAMRGKKGRSIDPQPHLKEKAMRSLPFMLTPDQVKALDEIEKDMISPNAMLRLLQGDVGSGKTIVAFLAMLNAIGSGTQVALLAPTEILARQHFDTLKPWAEASGALIALLTGRTRGEERAVLLKALAEGSIQILVGTHAIFQDEVEYRDLGLVVVDEQHRFGVFQRLVLSRKSKVRPDMLVMTATPIPRSLTLTYYGDMEVSRLEQKPPGRKKVETRIIPLERLQEVESALQREIKKGGRVFWVTPFIEEHGLLPFAAAEERFKNLKTIFGDHVGLVHSRMRAEQKDKAMEAFVTGQTRVLVATTVIEVGVNVPEATVMVVENAERFGLAQLHQLRGRVGRSNKDSFCLLLSGQGLTNAARARLAKMRETDNGFEIAEEDLRLRGAGEILGTKQSGLPEFRIADLDTHHELLEMARDEAKLILLHDPKLQSERGEKLRALLYLFGRDEAAGYLESG